jgi:hypothetical protein
LGFSTFGEMGPSPPPLGPGPIGRVFCAWSGIMLLRCNFIADQGLSFSV